MRFVVKELVLGLLIGNQLTSGCCDSHLNEPLRKEFEKTYTLITNAETDEQVMNATHQFKETDPNDAHVFEPGNIYSNLALFHCALKVSRMLIDDVYAREIRPGATTLPSSPTADEAAIAKDFNDYMYRMQEGLADRIRKAYVNPQKFDLAYQERWSKTLAKTAKLFRRFEGKIREIVDTYDHQRETGNATHKIGLWHVFKNYGGEWNFTFDDMFCVNRIRHAEKVRMITYNWLDRDNKTVIPYCVQY